MLLIASTETMIIMDKLECIRKFINARKWPLLFNVEQSKPLAFTAYAIWHISHRIHEMRIDGWFGFVRIFFVMCLIIIITISVVCC